MLGEAFPHIGALVSFLSQQEEPVHALWESHFKTLRNGTDTDRRVVVAFLGQEAAARGELWAVCFCAGAGDSAKKVAKEYCSLAGA